MDRTPFLVGVDLGTTNCAVAFVDTRRAGSPIEIFPIAQLVAPHEIEQRTLLPSFLYFGERHEIEDGSLALPWDRHGEAVAGALARERGALVPARQVSSAKSWLAHPGVDRRARLLPGSADPSDRRVSPVEASARYLGHIREAWNAVVARGADRLRLEQQSVILTVPASFDEEARELTVEAARLAGLERLTLLEEPLAAFYAWLSEGDASSRGELRHDQIALVCDVGGGTSDFTLIRVIADEGETGFERVAVGEHLLLGGDNVDLALAALVEAKLGGSIDGSLRLPQRHALRRQCSAAKERLLAQGPSATRVALTVVGSGRALVGGTVTTELNYDEVRQTLTEGFLPVTAAGEMPAHRDRRMGLRELGLPYEADPAITRHLAAFLARAAGLLDDRHPARVEVDGVASIRPELVLFNGGFFAPLIARERVVDVLAAWFGARPRLLASSNLEAAVAVGAAHYGRLRPAGAAARRRAWVRAGSARTYYVGVATEDENNRPQPSRAVRAVCVMPRGTEEGTRLNVEHEFTVTTNRPVSFTLYSSTTRRDPAGSIVRLSRDDDLHEHAPLVTVLRYGRKSRLVALPVRLTIAFTEVGTLELWCESQVSEHRWRLQFQLRGLDRQGFTAEPSDTQATSITPAEERDQVVIAEAAGAAGERIIRSVFSPAIEASAVDVTPENLVAQLEATFGYGKMTWPVPVIRRLADILIERADARIRTARHEARWLNLFGFCLRPGFGAAKDPWRISQARSVYAAGLAFPADVQDQVEWLVLWQRIAGGLGSGQQHELAKRIIGELGLAGRKASRLNPQIERESWRLIASLERIDPATRVDVGDELIRRIRRDPRNASFLWAIGRLGARTPFYGPLSSSVPAAAAERWIAQLAGTKLMTPDLAAAIVQIGAVTGDSLRDVAGTARETAATRLAEAGFNEQAIRPLRETVGASAADASRVFGEPLPQGLHLVAG